MPIGADDACVGVTFLSGLPETVLSVYGLTSNGLGKDIYTLTPKQITDFIHVFYSSELQYFAESALLKLSLSFFYLRIFPGPKIKSVIWSVVVVNVLFGFAFVIVGIFQCRPISYYWKNWDGEHEGTCLDVNIIGWCNAIVSIVLDIGMLGIPMSQLWGLKMHWKKKLGVAMMFLVGSL
jgi:hypothetical protein